MDVSNMTWMTGLVDVVGRDIDHRIDDQVTNHNRILAHGRIRLLLALISMIGLAAVGSLNAAELSATEPNVAIDAAAPLHLQIDQFLDQVRFATPAERADEAPLVRRLYLDLIGVPPTLTEMEAYLSDQSPERYTTLVNQLLQRPEFTEHWVKQFDLMMMERRANTHVPQDQWEAFLSSSIEVNQPINELARSILSANGLPGPTRAAARFYLDRGGDPHLITRDVGRVFFGRDLQCAQCHDHPLIDSYYQNDYHGLLSFFSGGYTVEVTEGDKKMTAYAEKSNVESQFESVFEKGKPHRALPKLFGEIESPQPWVMPGEDYLPATADGKPAQPIHSRRQQLATAATTGQVRAFNENWANRIWAVVFGRGIVHPVDLHHADNAPLNPELLRRLGTGLAELKFDLRAFVRELVTTQAYQRGLLLKSSDADLVAIVAQQIPSDVVQRAADLKQRKASLEAVMQERINQSVNANQALEAVEKQRTELLAKVDAARAAVVAANDALAKVATERAQVEAQVAAAKDKVAKFQAALDATNAAKAVAGEDAELAKNIEVLTQRVATATAAVAPIEAALVEKSNAVAAATAARDQTKPGLIAAQQAADPVMAQYAELSTNAVRARTEAEDAERQVGMIVAQLKLTEQAIEVAELAAKVQQARNQQAEAVAGESSVKAELAQIEKMLADTDLALGRSKADVQQKTEAVQVADQSIAIVSAEVQQLIQAKSSLEQAITLVGSNGSLPQSVQELATKVSERETTLGPLQQQRTALLNELTTTQQQTTAIEQQLVSLDSQRTEKSAKIETLARQLAESQAIATNGLGELGRQFDRFLEKRSQRFEQARLVGLTPEQLCWSLLTVTGYVERQQAAKLAELDKATPLTAEQQNDPAVVQARKVQAYRQGRADLLGNVNVFISLYGAAAGQPQSDFFATADQALFANNGGVIFSWSGPAGGNLTQKAIEAPDAASAARALYLGLLGRMPTEAEVAELQNYLAQAPDKKNQLIQEVVWGLMTSAEFRFNH